MGGLPETKRAGRGRHLKPDPTENATLQRRCGGYGPLSVFRAEAQQFDEALMSGHFILEGRVPPFLPARASVHDACIWLLLVLDRNSPNRRFVASVMLFDIEHGYVTEKQRAALQSIVSKTSKRLLDGTLEVCGGKPAETQEIGMGDVIAFPARGNDSGQVIE